MKLLHIDSSILGENSVSRTVTAAAVDQLTKAHPGIEVTYRKALAEAAELQAAQSDGGLARKRVGPPPSRPNSIPTPITDGPAPVGPLRAVVKCWPASC